MLPAMRRFNTAGPCEPSRHYMIPPLERLPEAGRLVEQGDYFVLHAPRQSGKTTTLRALARELTAAGEFAALHFTCELGEPAGDEYAAAQGAILLEIRERARIELQPELRPPDPWPATEPAGLLRLALSEWARRCPRRLALFFDEVDALRGESLRLVLRQLRGGFLDQLGLDHGTLAVFDRRPEAPPIEERTRFESARTPRREYAVTVLRG